MLFLFYLSAYIYMRERTTQMSKNYLSDPELTTKNPYWIERHRYYELKHFCLQYRIWKKARAAIDGMNPSRLEIAVRSQTGNVSNPTASAAEARLFYTNRIEMVENAARETDPVIGAFILAGVTEGVSYDILNARSPIPCSKDTYYNLYRRFFWLLNKERQ